MPLDRLSSGNNNEIHTGEFYDARFPFGKIFMLLGATSLRFVWSLFFPFLRGRVKCWSNIDVMRLGKHVIKEVVETPSQELCESQQDKELENLS